MLNKCCAYTPVIWNGMAASIGIPYICSVRNGGRVGMEGRDIKRIILGLVSLTCYAGPDAYFTPRPLLRTRAKSERSSVWRLNP